MRYVNECRRTCAIKKHDIAAYIWSAYTVEEPAPACSAPKAWENGSLCAPAKFPGHQWPRKPLWGYVNEADPYVMEMEIAAAADHGVNVFIYDWYWYDHRPFPEQCLDNGFLRAGNRDRMKFYFSYFYTE